jgi:thymidine phosphorylase
LQGRGPDDLVQLTLDLAERVSTAARPQLHEWLNDGTAWAKFVAVVEAQDGDASALDKIATVHRAPIIHPLHASSAGTLTRIDAEAIGRASVFLGGGRAKVNDQIDYAVGISRIKKIGERVEPNEPLLFVHAREDHALASVLPLLEKAITIE